MKKLAVFCMAWVFVLSLAGCSRKGTAVSFAENDFSAASRVRLYNCHNGQSSFLSDEQSVAEICAFIRTLSGASAKEQEGFYEGSYTVTLMDAEETLMFEIGFGDSDVFYYRVENSAEVTRFDMAGLTVKEILSFLSQYDTSGFQWG